MHPYLPHLLADIKEAWRTQLPEAATPTSFEEEMEEIERWVAGEEPAHTFSYYCGLRPEDFPPASQLSQKDLRTVCRAFREMMTTWNLNATFPKKLPLPIHYTMLVRTLDEKTDIPTYGFMNFDYCSGSPDECVFGAYCSCIERKKQMEKEEFDLKQQKSSSDDELPF